MNNITLDQILDLLPCYIDLNNIDYTDNLHEFPEWIEKMVKEGNGSPYYELSNCIDYECNVADEYFEQLQNDVAENFNLSEDEASDLMDKYHDEIFDVIYERNEGDAIGDLIRNTGKVNFVYDTGIELNKYITDDDVYEAVNKIKKYLKIT